MSAHWRLALRYAAGVSVGALVIGGCVWGFYGAPHALSFGYGVFVGLICLVSTALTVSLLTGGSAGRGVAIGAASFVGRLGFAAAALGLPAYLDLWPAVAMLVGFVGVYVAENVLLVLGTPKDWGGFTSVVGDEARGVREEGVERKVEV